MKLKIEKIDDNMFVLISENGEIYNLKLKFYDLTNEPNIGDFIYINENLLDPKYKEYSRSYYFGPLNEPYGRDVKEGDIDFLIVEINGNKINLKRFYG